MDPQGDILRPACTVSIAGELRGHECEPCLSHSQFILTPCTELYVTKSHCPVVKRPLDLSSGLSSMSLAALRKPQFPICQMSVPSTLPMGWPRIPAEKLTRASDIGSTLKTGENFCIPSSSVWVRSVTMGALRTGGVYTCSPCWNTDVPLCEAKTEIH